MNRWLYRKRAARKARRLHEGEDLLKLLAGVARYGYGLTVWQWLKLAPPVGGHAPGSYHYQRFPDGVGKAFDAFGGGRTMFEYGQWIKANAPQVTEGIHNPNLSIRNGHRSEPTVWGWTTWAAHGNHVHVACR